MKNISCIGIDITTEYVQLAYAENINDEAESMSTSTDENKFLIPAVMYYRKANDTWYIGEEAEFLSREEGGELSCIKDYGLFFSCLFRMAENMLGFNEASQVCVTTENTTAEDVDMLYEALKSNGYDKEKVRIINHDEAFIYYSVSQKKELWVNDVVLLDFTKEHFKYKRLLRGRIEGGMALLTENEDISDELYYEMLSSDMGKTKADNRLLEFIKEKFKKHIVSSVFLTGIGFYDDWAKESIKEMCSRRRVFKGYNLFVKGACEAARERLVNEQEMAYKLLCDGRTKADIGLKVGREINEAVILLSKSGENYIEAGAIVYCIADDVNDITLVLTDAVERETRYKKIDISGLDVRNDKTTKVQISIAYRTDEVFDVEIKDVGFGDFYEPSEKIVTETIYVKDVFED